MVAACDVGMLFLNHWLTFPDFPSQLLSYMHVKLPVLSCTDSNTDFGQVIEDRGFGWWCESNDSDNFSSLTNTIMYSNISILGKMVIVI